MTEHHTKTKKGMPVWHILILVLLGINLVISAITLLRKDPVWTSEEMKVGGRENFEILMKLYDSEDFKSQQKQGLVSALSSFGDVAQEENAQPTPPAAQEAKPTQGDEDMLDTFKSIKENGYIKGNENARFTILEYSEALCPYCKRQKDNGTIDQVLAKYPNQVNTIFKHFIVHAPATEHAIAFECAGEVGGTDGFYDYIAALFNLDNASTANFENLADEVGLNTKKFESCLEDNDYSEKAKNETNEGRSVFGVRGTPGNVIIDNETGRYVVIAGAYPFEKFDEEIQNLLNQ